MRLSRILLAAALFGTISTSARAQADLRDLNVEQTTAYNGGQARPSGLKVILSTDRADNTYVQGETLRLFLQVNEDAYITLFNIGPTGQVTQLFPNASQPNGFVQANRMIEVPPPGSGFRLTISGPTGAELIKAVASTKPLVLISDSTLQSQGPFKTLQGGVEALTRNLEVTANPPGADPDFKVAITNHIIRTVGQRPATVQGGVLAPVGLPPALQPLVAPQLPQSFPLLVAVDRATYRIGEKVVLAVTPLQACHLTVFNIGSTGQVRVLFPNRLAPNNQVGALQTTIISGGPALAEIEVSGPPGVEQIVAVCSKDPALIGPALDPAQVFAVYGPREALTRDLQVVAARPPGSTAVGSVSFTVQP